MLMAPASTRVLPVDVLAKLAEGSYEARSVRLQALVESQAKTLFGSDVRVRVQYTFDHHAIVATSANQPMWRVGFVGEGSDLRVLQAEPLDIPSYGADKLHEFTASECAKVVDALLSGDTAGAVEKMQALMPLADECQRDPRRVVESMRGLLQGERFWKRMLHGVEARGQLEDKAAVVLPKYSHLYEGDAQGSAGVVASIREDLEGLFARCKREGARLRDVQEWVMLLGERVQAAGRSMEAVYPLAGWVGDLQQDLLRVEGLVTDAQAVLQGASELGEVHDLLAGALPQYELAARFMDRLVRRLQMKGSE